MDQVSVRVHQSGQNHASTNINLLCLPGIFARFDPCARIGRNDQPVAQQHSSIFDDPEFGKSAAPA
jgi:hypothetical protein